MGGDDESNGDSSASVGKVVTGGRLATGEEDGKYKKSFGGVGGDSNGDSSASIISPSFAGVNWYEYGLKSNRPGRDRSSTEYIRN